LGADKDAKESGFSATASSHDDKGFAFADLEVDPVEDGAFAVDLNEILDLEDYVAGWIFTGAGGFHRTKKKRPVRRASAMMIQRIA
jgi:hypothetical protein